MPGLPLAAAAPVAVVRGAVGDGYVLLGLCCLLGRAVPRKEGYG